MTGDLHYKALPQLAVVVSIDLRNRVRAAGCFSTYHKLAAQQQAAGALAAALLLSAVAAPPLLLRGAAAVDMI